MYNNTYSPGDSSSGGSFYNGRASHALLSTDTIPAKVEDLVYDICSKNWTLPTLTQVTFLVDNSSTFYTVFSPVLAGYYSGNDGLKNNKSYGYWWARTVKNSIEFYELAASKTALLVDDAYVQTSVSIRCLAKQVNTSCGAH